MLLTRSPNLNDVFQRPLGVRPPVGAADAQPRPLVQGNAVLKSVRPNLGVEVEYRRRLDRLIREMHDSILYWVRAAYRANEPRVAQDETPAAALAAVVGRLSRRWQDKFDEAAEGLATYFSTAAEERSSATLRRVLRDGGWSVRFQMTRTMRDVLAATVNQNVALIKSIPQQYLSDVEGLVQRSVQSGRDLGKLTRDLERRYAVTRRRAALIARDQNNKATSAFNRVRQQDLGITEAVWMHSHAGEEPRPSHVRMDGKRYRVDEGMWDEDEGEYVWPGQLINCRCTSRPVVPGFA